MYLKSGFDRAEAIAEIDFLYDVVAGLGSKDILMGSVPSKTCEDEILAIVKGRTTSRRPLQQLAGKAYFMGEVFAVNEHTLVPRPETELLVLEAKNAVEQLNRNVKILDIGTGSGCISVSLAKLCPQSNVLAVDISEKALNIAKQNAKDYGVSEKMEFKESDLFSNVEGKFDIIVSNPPYIPLSELENLQYEVKEFEPHGALFTKDELGIDFYARIIDASGSYLNKGGFLLFELGISQSALVKDLMLKKSFSEIRIVKDLNNIDRVILGKLN